jgi:cytochrome c oxidase subunit 1
MPGGAPAGGWTMYPPLVLQTGDAFPFLIFSVHLMGISSIMGSINVIVTIINMRAPDMTLLKMPMFVWTWLITAYLLIAVMPVLAGAVTMLLTDQFFGTSFFLAAGGGDPVMFQHIFWFFGHPEVYIMILPAFGVVSEIIPTFSRKPLFGHDSMVYAASCIAFLSFIVWAHHMFTVGMPCTGQLFFMFATMLIAVPTGVKIFNWVATMWRGAMTFETPMLFSLAFVFLFTIGGFSGLMLALAPADVQYHWCQARFSPSWRALTTGYQSGPGTCTTKRSARSISGRRPFSSTSRSSQCTSWGLPACRVVSRITPRSLLISTPSRVSALSALAYRNCCLLPCS